VQFQGEEFQIYVAQGHELYCPVQILEPASLTAVLRIVVTEEEVQEIEFKMATLSSIDFTLSIQNVALLNAISCSIVDTLKTPEIEPNLLPLSTVELSKIKKLSSALQKNDDAWESESAALAAGSAGVAAGDDPTAGDPGDPAAKSGPRVPARKIRVNVTVPDVSFAVVNDLQGFDTALFKVIARTLVGGGSMSLPASGADPFPRKKEEGPSATQFEFHLAAYFQADYYDVSTNLWEAFLVKPLEITVNGKRDREKKFGSNRMISCLDVESHPCHVSFSEQFLVSIGAATNMWSLYSGAINNAVGVDSKKATSHRPPNAEPTTGENSRRAWRPTPPGPWSPRSRTPSTTAPAPRRSSLSIRAAPPANAAARAARPGTSASSSPRRAGGIHFGRCRIR